MSLADDLDQLTPQLKDRSCRTCAWLNEQDDRTIDRFWEWIDDGNSPKQLFDLCLKYGLDVGDSSFMRHVNGPRDKHRGTR